MVGSNQSCTCTGSVIAPLSNKKGIAHDKILVGSWYLSVEDVYVLLKYIHPTFLPAS